ncbi:hypothetical protein NQ317_005774 [Molorchus minor]|uniref:tRNA pseudouridine synthase n=1 Tax=Molorchus minor TaxID=1323400 RepID=A0ABQ9JAV9_9CUCU|nr:hypothetical protein NQ317_005774 [Molorchus minor]
MTKKIDIKKQIKPFDNLNECTKEELIERIKCLSAHNTQLKNILAKSEDNIAKEHKNNSFNFSKYNFRHIALKIFYLGWDYQGYVTQENTTNTIEYHLFEALIRTRLIERRSSANYHRCGRTDKGVSSFGQTVSITVRSKLKR